MMLKSCLPFFAACSLFAGNAFATPITNGGFDNGLDDWTITTTNNGSVFSGVGEYDVDNDGVVNNAVYLQVGQRRDISPDDYDDYEGAGISQLFTATSTGIIQVDFATQSFSNNASGGLYELLIDGLVSASYNVGRIADSFVARGTLISGLISAGTHEVEIRITRPYYPAMNHWLDNVAFVSQTAAVPEPASVALLGLGLLAIRRRKAA